MGVEFWNLLHTYLECYSKQGRGLSTILSPAPLKRGRGMKKIFLPLVAMASTVLLSWGIIGELDSPPIIIGHSAGGLLTQILLDHGYGAAGVAIDSVPAEGVKVVPVSQIRSLFPILKYPANRHKAVGFTPEQFHYAFTSTLSR